MVHTTLVAVVSKNGKIANFHGDMSQLSSAPDTKHLRAQLRAYDLLLFGRTTYEKDCKNMAPFHCVVVSNSVNSMEERTPKHWLWNPQSTPYEEMCRHRGATTVGVFGGAKVYTLALNEHWLDELLLTYVPVTIQEPGIPLFINHPNESLWSSLDSGALGFELSAPPKLLPESETLPSPPELRHYKKKEAPSFSQRIVETPIL